jgi:hypothetical protein
VEDSARFESNEKQQKVVQVVNLRAIMFQWCVVWLEKRGSPDDTTCFRGGNRDLRILLCCVFRLWQRCLKVARGEAGDRVMTSSCVPAWICLDINYKVLCKKPSKSFQQPIKQTLQFRLHTTSPTLASHLVSQTALLPLILQRFSPLTSPLHQKESIISKWRNYDVCGNLDHKK